MIKDLEEKVIILVLNSPGRLTGFECLDASILPGWEGESAFLVRGVSSAGRKNKPLYQQRQ